MVEPGETGLAAALQSVLRFLYCTWYSEMVTSLWGVVQVTLRAGFTECIALDTATPVTWDGTNNIQKKYGNHTYMYRSMYKMYLSAEVSSVT